jgi:hypothetical protein
MISTCMLDRRTDRPLTQAVLTCHETGFGGVFRIQTLRFPEEVSMSKFFAIAILVVCFVGAGQVFAQSNADRATTLAAELDKTKHKKKEKKGFSFETFVEVKNTPAAKEASGYSGIYSNEGDYSLNLSVAADGRATGSGHDTLDGENQVSFKLVDARVSGAVLKGTKAYSNGRTEPFEAVFVNRATAMGKNPNSIESRETAYGLGFIQAGKDWTNRVFLTSTR